MRRLLVMRRTEYNANVTSKTKNHTFTNADLNDTNKTSDLTITNTKDIAIVKYITNNKTNNTKWLKQDWSDDHHREYEYVYYDE